MCNITYIFAVAFQCNYKNESSAAATYTTSVVYNAGKNTNGFLSDGETPTEENQDYLVKLYSTWDISTFVYTEIMSGL